MCTLRAVTDSGDKVHSTDILHYLVQFIFIEIPSLCPELQLQLQVSWQKKRPEIDFVVITSDN